MSLDPLQSTFLGSQLLMSAFSLFLFATYRQRFLLYFSFVALIPLANLLLRHQFVVEHWPLAWTSPEGFRWFTLCLGHGMGLLYAVDLTHVARKEESYEHFARRIGHICIVFSLVPLAGLMTEQALFITGIFIAIYFIALVLWYKRFRASRTISIYMLAAVALIGVSFVIDYNSEFRLQDLSVSMRVLYSFAVLTSFFLFLAANIVAINTYLHAKESARLDVEQRAKMATLGEIASSIAHEIKNPLAAISYANEIQKNLIQKDGFDRDQAIRLCNNIAKTSGQIKSIVDSLHTLSRNAAQDPFEIVDVSTIIDRTLTLFTLRLHQSDVLLKLPKVRDNLDIECRETQICQVLLNLLNNAFDAVQSLDEKWVRLGIVEQENKVVFSVIDSGKGIPEEERTNILRSFYTTKAKGQGTGLGLNITKRIIDAHEGKLNVTERDGHTCFEVILPRRIH